LKILVATPYYPPHVGGAERYCREICVGLHRRHDWNVVVATSAIGAPAGISEDEGVVVHRMPAGERSAATWVSLSWYRRLARLIEAESPDVVVAHSPPPFVADLAALSARSRPFVLTYHAGSMAKGRRAYDFALGVYERFVLAAVLRRARAVIHCSPDSARFGAGLARYDAQVITPGVDIERFSPNGSSSGSASVLYVGRLEQSSRWKGVRHLLDAIPAVARSISPLRVDIVGDGDDRPLLEDHSRAQGLDGLVHFHGALQGDALVERYRAAGVVVLPSTTSAESFPLVVLEAAACGRPVVASSVGSVPDAVRDGETGFLVAPGDPRALAESIVTVLGDQDLAAALGQAGAERIRNGFSWDARVDATREVLESVVR
jgi:glycosyltransferase involved in cell wall biosynthesis